MAVTQEVSAARLNIDYPETLDRVTTAFRMLWIIPIAIILSVLSAQATSTVTIVNATGQVVAQLNRTSAGIGGALFAATLLMILFRQRCPPMVVRLRAAAQPIRGPGRRVRGPADRPVPLHRGRTVGPPGDRLPRCPPEPQPMASLGHVTLGAVIAVIAVFIAWFAILFTGRDPRSLFDYVGGVGRWALRVQAYATLLVTDHYPPFRLS